MRWIRTSLFCLAAGVAGTAFAEEPAWRATTAPGVTLGRPKPLAPPAAGTVRPAVAATPTGTVAPHRQTSFSPAPTVVRAAPADEPRVLGALPAAAPANVPPVARHSTGFIPTLRQFERRQVIPPPPIAPIRTMEVVGAGGLAVPPPLVGAPLPGRALDKLPAPSEVPMMPTAPAPRPAPSGLYTLPGEVSFAPANSFLVHEGGDPFVAPTGPDGMPVPGVFDGMGGYAGPQRFYVRAEYLYWWTRGYRQPPLVTSGDPTAPEDSRGALGSPGTSLLFGNNTVLGGPRSGGRFTAGWNFGGCSPCSIEGSYFFLGRRTDHFAANSGTTPVLGRPFINVDTGLPDRELTTTPGLRPGDIAQLRGGIFVDNFSSLQGAEANLRRVLCCGCDFRVSGLVGFRWLDLHEGLTITEDITSLKAIKGTDIFNPGTHIRVVDSFQTRNRFYGGQLGLDGELRRGNWFVGGSVKVGLGVTNQTIDIAGNQLITAPNGQQRSFNGGLLAVPSNIGRHTRDQFSVVPEVGVKLGYQFTDHLRVFVGYNFLYWTNVVRPGDQIDPVLNVAQIPNFTIGNQAASQTVRPIVPFRNSDFWAQGINAGLEFHY